MAFRTAAGKVRYPLRDAPPLRLSARYLGVPGTPPFSKPRLFARVDRVTLKARA